MTYTEQAMSIACENEYEPKDVFGLKYIPFGLSGKANNEYISFIHLAFLDPAFWRALGRGLGWEEKMVVRRGVVIGLWAVPTEQLSFKEVDYQMDYVEGWSFHWHRFIDHLAEGKDTENYFKNLLEK